MTEQLLVELEEELTHIASCVHTLSHHLEEADGDSLWLCKVDADHIDVRVDSVLLPKLEALRSLLLSGNRLVEPPWLAQKE